MKYCTKYIEKLQGKLETFEMHRTFGLYLYIKML